jgi:murein DD-endopeptidase MepM/ murein hydrolase activator NlpD
LSNSSTKLKILLFSLTGHIKSDLEQVKEIYENENKTKDERIKQLEELNIQYNNYLDSLPFGSPVKDIIIRSDFGYRKDPFTKLSSFHYGVDLHTSYREPIISSGNGKVVWSSWFSGYGYCVQIKHPLEYKSLYGHLDQINVKVDQNVSKGDTIGLAGTTGRSTSVHLHYEIILNGNRINPNKYLQYFKVEMLVDSLKI